MADFSVSEVSLVGTGATQTGRAVKVTNCDKVSMTLVITTSAATLVGTLTLKGVSKEITVPASFTHLPDKLGARLGDEKVRGDLLVVRTQFTIQRADFGIMAGQMTDKVAESIALTLSIAGAAPKA